MQAALQSSATYWYNHIMYRGISMLPAQHSNVRTRQQGHHGDGPGQTRGSGSRLGRGRSIALLRALGHAHKVKESTLGASAEQVPNKCRLLSVVSEFTSSRTLIYMHPCRCSCWGWAAPGALRLLLHCLAHRGGCMQGCCDQFSRRYAITCCRRLGYARRGPSCVAAIAAFISGCVIRPHMLAAGC
jgi:hypothetical protein